MYKQLLHRGNDHHQSPRSPKGSSHPSVKSPSASYSKTKGVPFHSSFTIFVPTGGVKINRSYAGNKLDHSIAVKQPKIPREKTLNFTTNIWHSTLIWEGVSSKMVNLSSACCTPLQGEHNSVTKPLDDQPELRHQIWTPLQGSPGHRQLGHFIITEPRLRLAVCSKTHWCVWKIRKKYIEFELFLEQPPANNWLTLDDGFCWHF